MLPERAKQDELLVLRQERSWWLRNFRLDHEFVVLAWIHSSESKLAARVCALAAWRIYKPMGANLALANRLAAGSIYLDETTKWLNDLAATCARARGRGGRGGGAPSEPRARLALLRYSIEFEPIAPAVPHRAGAQVNPGAQVQLCALSSMHIELSLAARGGGGGY